MLGLFGALNLASRSLQTQQQGVEVAGHNIANVNNPAYARQRLQVETSPTIDTPQGPEGTGAEVAAIQSLRSTLLDQQITSETSVGSYLQAQQTAFQYAQSYLGQTVDTSNGTTSGSGAQNGLAAGLSDLFNAFQSLSTNPSSATARQMLVAKAADLAGQFNQIDQRLGNLKDQLNASLQTDTASANDLLSQIADLNAQILRANNGSSGAANDLMDLRQQKLESLAKLTKIDVATESNGAVDVSVAGTTMVSGQQVLDTMETYDAGGGQMLVRAHNSGATLALTGGSLAGTIDARDGEVATLRSDLNTLAAQVISQVNSVHATGFNSAGGSGASFFTGTGSADIQVNRALLNDPSLVQASGTAGAAGDNKVALALAQLANQAQSGLSNQTFSQSYSQTVAALGQAAASVNTNLQDETSVQTMLSTQRDSVSGVSLDEEMTSMMQYQKSYEASARLVSVVATMLDTVLNMKQ